jgi:hypothetical protein
MREQRRFMEPSRPQKRPRSALLPCAHGRPHGLAAKREGTHLQESSPDGVHVGGTEGSRAQAKGIYGFMLSLSLSLSHRAMA